MKSSAENFLITAAACFIAVAVAIFITETVGCSVGAPFVTGDEPAVGEIVMEHSKSSADYLRELRISPEDRMRYKLEGGAWWISILLASAFVGARGGIIAIFMCASLVSIIMYSYGAQHAAVGAMLAGVVAGILNLLLYESVRAKPW